MLQTGWSTFSIKQSLLGQPVYQVGPHDKHLRNTRDSLHIGRPSPQAEPLAAMKSMKQKRKWYRTVVITHLKNHTRLGHCSP